MKFSRNRLTAVVGISVFGLLLQGCGEPANTEATPGAQTPTDTQSSEVPLGFDERIPEALRAVFVENGWNPGQYLELPEAVEAQEGVDYELVCEYNPDQGEDWTSISSTVQGSLGEQGDLILDYDPVYGSGPYGEWRNLVYVSSDCSGQRDITSSVYGDSGWDWLSPQDIWPTHHLEATRSGDQAFVLGIDFEVSDNWAIYSFDTTARTGQILASNHDVESHYSGYRRDTTTSMMAFNNQAGAIALLPVAENEYGAFQILGTEPQLLWFDLLRSHPVVELGPGSAVTATDDGIYLVQTGLGNGGEVIKFLPNSSQEPDLDTAPSLLSLPADIGYKITGLDASGEKLLAVLQPVSQEGVTHSDSAIVLILDISENILSFTDLGPVEIGLNVKLVGDAISWLPFWDSYDKLRLDTSTGKLLKSTELFAFNGDYALNRTHIAKLLP